MLSEIEIDEEMYDELKLRSAKTEEGMLELINRYIYGGLMKDD